MSQRQPKTMRAVILTEAPSPYKPGAVWHPIQVQDRDIPQPDEGEVLIKIHAAAYNRRDYYVRRSLYPGIIFPSIPGSDCVGTVVAPAQSPLFGKKVLIAPHENWKDDPRAPDNPEKPFGPLGNNAVTEGRGTFAEYIVAAEENVVEAPDHLVSREQGAKGLAMAASLPLGGLTAYRIVFTKAQVRAGDRVLITGIGGGVASILLQLCTAAGAEVYVTSSSQEKIDGACKLGAKGGVNYKEDGWAKKLQKQYLDDAQLDVVIDSGGGEIVKQVGRAIKPGGCFVAYGSTSEKPTTVSMLEILKNVEYKGSTMGSLAEFKKMVAFVSEHKIMPIVDTILQGLDKAEEGFKILEKSTQLGKVTILVDQGADSAQSTSTNKL